MTLDLTVWKECEHEQCDGWDHLSARPCGLSHPHCLPHPTCSGRIPDEEATQAVKDVLEAMHRISEIQPRTLQTFIERDIRFKRAPLVAPVTDGQRWEQIAFSIYTTLCEVDGIANAALSRLNEGRSEG